MNGRVLPTHRARHTGFVTSTPTMRQRRWRTRENPGSSGALETVSKEKENM